MIAADRTRSAMFRSMLRIRRAEEAIAVRYDEQEMRCPVHLCIGQEAIPAAISAHLDTEDKVFSAHRSHGHYLAKGGSMRAMVAELYGRATGCARGKGGSQHLVDVAAGFMGSAPILASVIPIGVGVAWAGELRGDRRLSVIYFGDGATEEGAFHEALNFAGTHRLPVLFVCENNLYSVHSPLSVRQPASREIAEIATAHGMAGVQGDGNDADAVWSLAKDAVSRARAGEGPTLLELKTYRWLEHCGPREDGTLGYRSADELEHWKNLCPISRYRKTLHRAGILSAEDEAAMTAEIDAEIDDALTFARGSAFPAAEELFQYVFPS